MFIKTCQAVLLAIWLSGLNLDSHASSFFSNPPKPDSRGFLPLFNGRNLDGWVNVNCAPETWSVTNGLIHCTGNPIGALRTERQYENFILELEWRHLKSGGNAGIFIWSSPISAPGVPFLRAVEVQVLDHGYGNTENYTTHGDVFPIHGSTMEPFGKHRGMRSFPSEQRSNPSPEWNKYRIVATNGVIRLSVNGKEVSGGSNCNWRKGYIGLESEGSRVDFRNIRIQELPSTGATPEQSAPEETDWTALYNGVDLRGWKSSNLAEWQSNDWQLFLIPDEQKKASLSTTKSYRDFELSVDFKTPAKLPTSGTIGGLTLDDQTIVSFGDSEAPMSIGLDKLKPKAWNRVRLVRDFERFSVYLNGQFIGKTTVATKRSAEVGLANAGQPLEFANIYIRPLR
ncbi:MAG TPA: family 16 glycoside hydrolase [Verrucomicrobiae bacterium]